GWNGWGGLRSRSGPHTRWLRSPRAAHRPARPPPSTTTCGIAPEDDSGASRGTGLRSGESATVSMVPELSRRSDRRPGANRGAERRRCRAAGRSPTRHRRSGRASAALPASGVHRRSIRRLDRRLGAHLGARARGGDTRPLERLVHARPFAVRLDQIRLEAARRRGAGGRARGYRTRVLGFDEQLAGAGVTDQAERENDGNEAADDRFHDALLHCLLSIGRTAPPTGGSVRSRSEAPITKR